MTTMCAKWNNKKIEPKSLANRLNKRIELLSGKFSNYDSITADILTVINSSLEFDSKIPETEKRNIVWKAISSAIEKNNLTENLLGEISKEENLYINLNPQRFVLVTSISVNYFGEINKVNLQDNTTIIFNKFLPQKFNRKSILESANESKIVREDEIPNNFVYVRVNVKARTILEAFDKAIDGLDFLRGIWNLFFNQGVGRRWSSGKTQINKIILGPIHTLHKSNGKLATENYWYENNFRKPLFSFQITNEYEKLKKYERAVRTKILKSNYNIEIENSILRYARALDEKNFNNSFLALWSLFENLTGSVANYKDAIDRTLFLYKDREFHKIILEHLRMYRNMTVHTGDSISEDLEILLFQLKGYVEMLLRFHLFNTLKFKDIAESAQFLSFDPNREVLKKKINWLTKAEKFLQNYDK